MKKIIMICIFLLLISSLVTFGEENIELDIEGISTITLGEKLSGHITAKQGGLVVPYTEISYRLMDEDGRKIYNIGQLRSDKYGQVTFEIDYPDYVETGRIKLEFSSESNLYVYHTVIDDSPINVHVNSRVVNFGDQISFTGYTNLDENLFKVVVQDINEKEIISFETSVKNHEFGGSFDIPDVSGTYSIVINHANTGISVPFMYTDNVLKIVHPSDITTDFGVRPTLPEKVNVELDDSSVVEKSVEWNLSRLNLNRAGYYSISGIVEGNYATHAFVTVKPYVEPDNNGNDNDNSNNGSAAVGPSTPNNNDNDEKVSTIDDLIPQANSQISQDQKEKLQSEADKLIKNLKKSKSSSNEIRNLNKSLNKALAILDKKETVLLVKDMADLVNDSMNRFSTEEATSLVKDLIKETYDNALKNPSLSKKEKKDLEILMKKTVESLMSEKASVSVKEGKLDIATIEKAIDNVNNLKGTLGDSKLDVKSQLTIDFDKEGTLDLDQNIINRLSESKMDVHIKSEGVEFSLPAELVSKLGTVEVKSSESKVPLKKTDNGQVKNLKTMSLTVSSNGKSVDNGVVLSMPIHDLDLDLDTLMVAVLENDVWIKLDYEIKDDRVVFTAPHFSTYSLLSFTPSFNDIKTSWANKYITSLTAKGLIVGKDSKTFDPNGHITRAEFVTMLINHLNISDEAVVNFQDADGWYKQYLSTAKAIGLTYGSSYTEFRPNDPITRQEMAMMIQVAYKLKHGYELEGQSTPFSDHSQIAKDATSAVYAMKVNGIISGYPDNTFKPSHTATRAEAATILYKLINQ